MCPARRPKIRGGDDGARIRRLCAYSDSLPDRCATPSSANDTRPQSNAASQCAANRRPLKGSSRSASDAQSFHGFAPRGFVT